METETQSPQRKLRRGGYLVVLGLTTALFLAITGPVLPYVLTAWAPALSPDLADHRVHDAAIAAALVVALVGILAQWWRAERHAAPWQQAVLVFVWIFAIRAASADVFPPPLVFVVLLGVAGALHPARAHLLPRVHGRPVWALLALGAVLLVAAAPYALDQMAVQRVTGGTGDAHAEAGHWSSMAAVATLPAALVALAALRAPGWRITAACGAFLAAVTGGISLAFPQMPSAYPAWAAAAALAWAAAVALVAWRAGEPAPGSAGAEAAEVRA